MKDDARFELLETCQQNRIVHGYLCKSIATDDFYYFARRRHKGIYRGREKSVSDALTKGVAGWAMDITVLAEMKRRGVKFVGVWLKDLGDTYVTPIESYYDPAKTSAINYTARGGAHQKVLTMGHFEHIRGAVSF